MQSQRLPLAEEAMPSAHYSGERAGVSRPVGSERL